MKALQPSATGVRIDEKAHAAISALVVRERQSRDRGWWRDMAACFTPDATIRLSWFEGGGAAFVDKSRAMAERGDYAVHHLGPPAIRMNLGRALVELPVGIVFVFDLEGVPATLTSWARMQYRAEKSNDDWLISRITSIYEYDALASRASGEIPGIDLPALHGLRSSYCCLSWYLSRRGYEIGDDLLGDDRPAPISDHYRTENDWLGGMRGSGGTEP